MKIKTRGFISAFPGVGKSTIYRDGYERGLYPMTDQLTAAYRMVRPVGMPAVYDSDSSTFDKTKFPANYIAHMRKVAQNEALDGFLMLVSSHDNVRAAMIENNIPFTLVYPDRSLKGEYLQRYANRNSPNAFIDLMANKWDDFIDSCEAHEGHKIVLQAGQFLADVID